MSDNNGAIDRPLSPYERIFYWLDRGASLNFVHFTEVRGPLDEQVLRRALEAMQHKHPLLRVRVDDAAAREPWFRGAGVGSIGVRVIDADRSQVNAEVEREINERFDWMRGPLLRAVLVRHAGNHATLLLTFCHVIGDGMSGVYLTRDLLAAAADASSPTKFPLTTTTQTASLDERLPPRVLGFSGFLKTLHHFWREALTQVRFGKPKMPPLGREARPHERRARFVSRTMQPELAKRLAAKANAESTSIHGALGAAFGFAFAEAVGHTSFVYGLGSPVNVRDRLDPNPGEAIGCFVTLVNYRGKIDAKTTFWQLARDIRAHTLNTIEKDFPLILPKIIPNFTRSTGLGRIAPEEGVANWQKLLVNTVGITNMGKIGIPTEYGPYSVESLQVAIALSGLGYLGIAVTSIRGAIHLNFTFTEPTMTEDQAGAILDAAIARLAREAN